MREATARVDDAYTVLCSVIQRCFDSDPSLDISGLSELVKTVLGRQRHPYEPDQLNRALESVFWRKQREVMRLAHPARPTGKYRSQLEAEWAAWLEGAGLDVLYEPKRFRRGELVYVPDFYLTAAGAWLEIKPRYPDYLEAAKASMLAAKTGEPVFVVVGHPGRTQNQGYSFISLKYGEQGLCGSSFEWLPEEAPMALRKLDWSLVGDVLRQAGVLQVPAVVAVRMCVCGHPHADHHDPGPQPTVSAYCRHIPCGCPQFRDRVRVAGFSRLGDALAGAL